MNKKLFTTVFLLSAIAISSVLFTSCGGKRDAIGIEDEIIIVADSSDFYELEGVLLQVFEKVIYTPQPENLFSIKRRNYSELGKLKRKKNIVFLAPLDGNSTVAQYIKKALTPDVLSLVETDSAYVFNKYNLWANNQLVMFLTAPTLEKLKMKILGGHEDLLYYFQSISNKRLFKSLYNAKYERKEIEAKLLNDHGWIMYVQADFLLAMDKPEDNFVWLRRAVNTGMERWLFVKWVDNVTPAYLNADSIYAIRNRMTGKYYTTSDNKAYVEIAEPKPKTKEVNFQGRYALMTEGFWRFNDKTGGGPFVSYTFYDEATKRLYMLDGSIFAPKYYKKKLIQQVDVTLQSFKTEAELSQDKKEDLLDHLDD